MRRVVCRAITMLAVIAALAVPLPAFADDPLIQPPFPHAISSPVGHATFWQIVRIVLFNT